MILVSEHPVFDRGQLTIMWMSNIKEGGYKSRLHVSVNLLAGVWGYSFVLVVRMRPRVIPLAMSPWENQSMGYLFFLYGYGPLFPCPACSWSSTMNRLLVIFINLLPKESSLHIQWGRKFPYFWYTASGVSVHHLVFLPTCNLGYCKTKADLKRFCPWKSLPLTHLCQIS